MDEATFRILDTLSRELGSTISINQLTSKIMQHYGTGYYARTYNKLNDLSKQGLIQLTKAGRSSIASLGFGNYLLLDSLTEIELRKKRQFLMAARMFQILLPDMETRLGDFHSIESISLINPERNLKLNRAELLILLRNSSASLSNDILSMHTIIQDLAETHNIRIDSLMLAIDEFRQLLSSAEINPVRQMLSNQIVFHAPHAFWGQIGAAVRDGLLIKFDARETHPAKIGEKDLVYNLARLGYKEMGTEIGDGENICIESIITSILMKNDARRSEAVPILLAKNTANYILLIFLSQKYGLSDRLSGLLTALHTLKPTKQTALALQMLDALKVKARKANVQAIEEKMRLYHALR